MTRMLASVNSLAEAKLAYRGGADIIDLKQPERGALGALDTATVERICAWCAGKVPVSATVGDLPMQPDVVAKAVESMAATGVDYVKIGFFPGGNWSGVIRQLSAPAWQNLALIAVLFADTRPGTEWIDTLYHAGFRGVMLDTMDKSRGSLTDVMSPSAIERFTQETRSRGLLCGLAGSLRPDDIPILLGCRPDYLGFRGALCVGKERTAALDAEAVARIKGIIACTGEALPMI